ncbi:MAG: glycosyltransferase family 4 protein, partial [Bacteroidales bacterium]|nr:glycosyltransferase family 4 protein [Bacteroidales bacterium]
MKILVLSPKPPWPSHDGGAVATMRCIEGLAEAGAEVSLLAMTTWKHGQSREFEQFKPAYLKHYTTVDVNTRIRPFKMLANLLFSNEPYDLVRFRSGRYSEALRAFNPAEYDIIQCEGLPFALYLDEIKRLTSSPVVLRAHNTEHRIREMMAENSGWMVYRAYLNNLARRLQKTEKNAARMFDAVVPISEPDSRWFNEISDGKPVHLSETGADGAEQLAEPDGSSPRVGFIGALDWRPNLEGLRWFLRHVWPSVSRAVPLATLHIAGRGAPANVKRWLNGEKVSFEGEVDDARSFMASMNVIIAPLFAGSGLRIKIIEAMSIGRTVVA